MDRFKVYDATGIAPDGRLYAGDMNLFQDLVAALDDFAQTLNVASVSFGDSSLILSKYGAGEFGMSGALRVTGISKGLGGLFAGTFTTTQRNAMTLPLYGLIILNTTTNQHEWNKGTPAAPDWQPFSIALGAGSITLSMMAADSVDSSKIVAGSIVASDISGTLKPSDSAAAGTEALRALGATASTAAAGNDARLSDTRTPTDNTVSTAKIQNLAVTAGKIANDTITAAQIAPDAIGSSELAADAVGASELANNAVDSGAIVAGAVTDSKLASTFAKAISAGAHIEYGRGDYPSGDTAVAFAVAFSSVPAIVIGSDDRGNTDPVSLGKYSNPTVNGFTLTNQSGGDRLLSWIAFGA